MQKKSWSDSWNKSRINRLVEYLYLVSKKFMWALACGLYFESSQNQCCSDFKSHKRETTKYDTKILLFRDGASDFKVNFQLYEMPISKVCITFFSSFFNHNFMNTQLIPIMFFWVVVVEYLSQNHFLVECVVWKKN